MTASARVVLIRHGESACNVAGVVGGHAGCTGLSLEGKAQSGILSERLRSTGELKGATALYSSVLPRAVETAEAIASAVGTGKLEVTPTCDLCELHPGEADGLAWEEVVTRYGQPELFSNPSEPIAPGGESWQEFVERVRRTLCDLAARHPDELVVAACHGGVIEASMVSFLPFGRQLQPMRLPTAYTSLTEWELDSTGWRLVRYNDVAHLGGPYGAQSEGLHRPVVR
jgi:broad specificity phosphatase PhoE